MFTNSFQATPVEVLCQFTFVNSPFYNTYGHKLRWTVTKPNFSFLMRQLHFLYEGRTICVVVTFAPTLCLTFFISSYHSKGTVLEETGFSAGAVPQTLQRIRCKWFSFKGEMLIWLQAQVTGHIDNMWPTYSACCPITLYFFLRL